VWIAILGLLLAVQPRASDACAPLPADAVAWWTADGTAEDSIGGLEGILHGDAKLGPGKVGQAFDLTSAPGSHVRGGDAEAIRFSEAMSIECWVRPLESGAVRSLVSKWDAVPGPDQRSYALGLDVDGTPFFIVSPSGLHENVGLVYGTNGPALADTWTHLVASYDGAAVSLYVNGELRGSVPYSQGIFPGTDDLGIGASVGGVAAGSWESGFRGLLDEVTLYSRALGAGAVAAIFEAGGEVWRDEWGRPHGPLGS